MYCKTTYYFEYERVLHASVEPINLLILYLKHFLTKQMLNNFILNSNPKHTEQSSAYICTNGIAKNKH